MLSISLTVHLYAGVSTLAEVKCPDAHCTPLSIHCTAGPLNPQYVGCSAVTTPCWGIRVCVCVASEWKKCQWVFGDGWKKVTVWVFFINFQTTGCIKHSAVLDTLWKLTIKSELAAAIAYAFIDPGLRGINTLILVMFCVQVVFVRSMSGLWPEHTSSLSLIQINLVNSKNEMHSIQWDNFQDKTVAINLSLLSNYSLVKTCKKCHLWFK